ncbi:MAG: TMEM143 family protein [Polyangiaceae bacterium]
MNAPGEPTRTSSSRQRFIPFRRREIVDLLCREDPTPARLRAFASLVETHFHALFHPRVEKLKEHYFPFSPDRDLRTLETWNDDDLEQHEAGLLEGLTAVLDDANYEEVTKSELDHALREQSLFRVTLSIDFNAFDRYALYRRGDVVHHVEVPRMFFRKKTIAVPTFERVAMLVRFQSREYFEARKRKNFLFEPGSVVIKLFKNVPKADLEMLLPTTEVRMSWRDGAVLVVPGLVGAIFILLKTATPLLLAATILWSLFKAKFAKGENPFDLALTYEHLAIIATATLALGGIVAFVVKQWLNFKNRKMRFLKLLADNLYFKNLDNNEGVFLRLVDQAEEEESKELILAYAFLRRTGPMTEGALDELIERWIEERGKVAIDFEVDDALEKLVALGLVDVRGEGEGKTYAAIELERAVGALEAKCGALSAAPK